MKGWIKLHRQLKDHWINKDSEIFHLWINLLLASTHTYKKTMFNKKLVDLYPGQLIFGRKKWAEELKIDENKVYRTIKQLEEADMISIYSTNRYSIITINNWSLYQTVFFENRKNEHQNAHQGEQHIEQQNEHLQSIDIEEKQVIAEQQNEHQNEHTDEHPTNTIKNVKNVKNDKEVYKDIVEYLNKKASKNFRHSTKATQYKINARLEEGFALDDFKKVIDIKCSQWLGTDMEKYLRPETLFGTKFESYLNENIQKQQNQQYKNKQYNKPKKTRFHNFEQRTDKYSANELDDIAQRKMLEHLKKLEEQKKDKQAL